MTRIHTRLGDRPTYLDGLPTAETFALPYTELGVTTYSSAIFNFAPRFAVEFYEAVRAEDRKRIHHDLNEFVFPTAISATAVTVTRSASSRRESARSADPPALSAPRRGTLPQPNPTN